MYCKNSAPLDIANCNVFFEPKFSAGRPLRAARPSDAAAGEETLEQVLSISFIARH